MPESTFALPDRHNRQKCGRSFVPVDVPGFPPSPRIAFADVTGFGSNVGCGEVAVPRDRFRSRASTTGRADRLGGSMYLGSEEQAAPAVRAAVSGPTGGAFGEQVRSGGIVLEPGVGERLLAALDDYIAMADESLAKARTMSRAAPLGDNPVAHAMAEKFKQRADGGAGSLVDSLDTYLASLTDARDAVQEAMRRYADDQQAQAAELRRIAR
ncbi:hypothetical protein [Saccharopolyspora sp. 5N708]|uniref:hypothetical protein n=1 Tax=Saccharopolyspora sp. 5N708 TaxID=3457424 RepID=UPI003FCFB98E